MKNFKTLLDKCKLFAYSKNMNTLVNAGLRQTNSRVALLKFLGLKKGPVDVGEIEEYLNTKVKTNQATVYRILNTFYDKGIIERFEFKEGKYRYELSGSDHHHVVCEKCGKIEDISGCNLYKLEREVKEKTGYSIRRHSLEFFGLCQPCRQSK